MSLFLAALFASTALPVSIGAHYTDALAGLAVYRSAKQSVLLNIGWTGADGKVHKGYKALVEGTVHFCEAAPDDSYHRIWWNVGRSHVTYEWGLSGRQSALGRLTSTGPVELHLSLGPAWPGIKPQLLSNPNRVDIKSGDMIVSFNADGSVEPSGEGGDAWSERYLIDAGKPLQFSIGVGSLPGPSRSGKVLEDAAQAYKKGRLWAEGDWGDFLSPLEDQLGNSKIFSADTGRLAHIVSRNWCLPDGQVLFCWDSFFNGLMASLEDPSTAKKTVRAIIAESPPAGFVPNYGGRGWGVSSDRSQPCVGAYCVWKINQRETDPAFLREVYPKLLKWHRWWFQHRDGNHDGLLEWGSETGDLQNAKYESGLDDSPMFDDGKMNGATMDMDATDLNGLWAMDAEYLAKIAEKIGLKGDAAELNSERQTMAQRMNRRLWNEAVGAYCYRYWTPKHETDTLSPTAVFSAEGQPGFLGEYFQGRELKGEPQIRHDTGIDFNWAKGPMDGFGPNNYSIRWTADFTTPKTGLYEFEATTDDGCRVWLDDKRIIDAWTIHGATSYDAIPIRLKAGEKHKFRMEYFQAEGGASASLSVRRIVEEKPGIVFSPRLSPLNFYPLIAGNPSHVQSRRALDLFFRTDRFGGAFVCPTISRNDQAFPAQGYWRGTIWGPTSYLTYQGLRRFATQQELIDYAEKSVRLFMKNWINDGTCHENFNAMTGWGRSDPHYTWGALLCLVGLEQLCDTDVEGRVVLNGVSGRHVKIHNLRIGGKLYEVLIEPRKATLRRNGKVVGVARGKIASVRI